MKNPINAISKALHCQFIREYRIMSLSQYLYLLFPDNETLNGLDVGCGTGEISYNLQTLNPKIKIIGAEVLPRQNSAIEVAKFDGEKLPYSDNAFDFVLLIDALHHEKNYKNLFRECLRTAKRFIIIKDHFAETAWDKIRLCLMDWIGNKPYGVSLPYNFLARDAWADLFKNEKISDIHTTNQMRIYPRAVNFIFNKNIHFISRINLKQ